MPGAMNTEPMTIPEISLEYVTGGLADPPAPPSNDTTRNNSRGGLLGGFGAPSGQLGGYASGSDPDPSRK